jgi:hypothetical protein
MHPDPRVDVAVCPSGIPRELFDILHLPLFGPDVLTGETIAERDIGIGDEVYVAGMFVGRLGETRNLPVLRSGTIAAMPDEKIKTAYGYHDAYLIEARSVDGLSGSPVFVQMPPWRAKDGQVSMVTGHTHYLMGMLLGHNQVGNTGDTIEIVQPVAERPESKTVEVSVPINTGIGVVLPIADVVVAVEQPIIRERREARLADRAARSFAPDASGAPDPNEA